MGTTGMGTTTAITVRGTLRGLLAGLAGFLVGEYGSGQVLLALARTRGTSAAITWSWLPWLAAALLCGVAVGLFTGRPGLRRWWYWPAAGAVVPVGAFFVTWGYFAAQGVPTPSLWLASLVQVAVAGGLALGLGVLRELRGPRLVPRRRV